MKYGKNGQSGAYNQAGGELTLTNDAKHQSCLWFLQIIR